MAPTQRGIDLARDGERGSPTIPRSKLRGRRPTAAESPRRKPWVGGRPGVVLAQPPGAIRAPDPVAALVHPLAPGGGLILAMPVAQSVRHLDEWFEHDVNLDFVLHEPACVVGTVEAAGLLDIEWYLRGPATARGEATPGHPRGPRRATLVNHPGDLAEVIADRAPALANVIEELVPAALHNTGQYVREQPGRVRSRPAEGTAQADARTEGPHRTASVVIRGRAFCPERVMATTSWQSTPCRCSSWRPHSTNSHRPSDEHGPGPA